MINFLVIESLSRKDTASFSPSSPQNLGDISHAGWIFHVAPIVIGVGRPLAKELIHVHEKSGRLKYVDVSYSESSIINRKTGLKRDERERESRRCSNEQGLRKGWHRQEMIMKCRYRHRGRLK